MPEPKPSDEIAELTKRLEELEKAKAEEVAKAKAEAEEAIAKAKAEAEAAKPLAEQIAVLKADAAAAQAELASAKEAIAKAETERQAQRWADIAKSDYAALGAPAELGPMLQAIAAAVPPEHLATLERVLKSANAQLTSSIHMRQIASGMLDENSALARITKMAQTLVDTGAAPTIEQAKLRVLKDRPDLAAEYAAQRV